jgi:hypothetical protein
MAAKNGSTKDSTYRRGLVDPGDPRTARSISADWLKGAMMGVFHAFNLANNPDVPFCYDEKTVEEVTGHCRALLALQAAGELRPKLGAVAEGDADATQEPRMIPWADPRLKGALKQVRGNMAWIEAREDTSFQRFIEDAQGKQDGPVGPLHRQLRAAGRSAAAKRAWARRRRQLGPAT